MLVPCERTVICSAKRPKCYPLIDFVKRYINKLIKVYDFPLKYVVIPISYFLNAKLSTLFVGGETLFTESLSSISVEVNSLPRIVYIRIFSALPFSDIARIDYIIRNYPSLLLRTFPREGRGVFDSLVTNEADRNKHSKETIIHLAVARQDTGGLFITMIIHEMFTNRDNLHVQYVQQPCTPNEYHLSRTSIPIVVYDSGSIYFAVTFKLLDAMENSQREKFVHMKVVSENDREAMNDTCYEAELPLSMAAWNGDISTVQVLLDFDASIEAQNSQGDNVFHSLIRVIHVHFCQIKCLFLTLT